MVAPYRSITLSVAELVDWANPTVLGLSEPLKSLCRLARPERDGRTARGAWRGVPGTDDDGVGSPLSTPLTRGEGEPNIPSTMASTSLRCIGGGAGYRTCYVDQGE